MKKRKLNSKILKYLGKIGRKGGKKRARLHTKEELSAWAKGTRDKPGGRPLMDWNELSVSGRYARKRRERGRLPREVGNAVSAGEGKGFPAKERQAAN
jgi:hypothetical protein